MLNLLAAFIQKFDAVLVTAFQVIEKKKQPKKIDFSSLAPKKCKWEILYQKRLRKEQERRNKQKIIQINHNTRIQSSIVSNKEAINLQHKDAMKNEPFYKNRHALFIDKEVIMCQHQKSFAKIANFFNEKLVSFSLPQYVKFKEHFQIEQSFLSKIFHTLSSVFKKPSKNQVNAGLITNLMPLKHQPMQICKGRIYLLPKAFQDKTPFQITKIIKDIQDEFRFILLQQNNLNKYEQLSVQIILKQLRRAKIYRHSLTLQIQTLLGKYLIQSKGKYEHFQVRQSDYETSDIGLFNQQRPVNKEQQKQIIQFWQLRFIQVIQEKYSCFKKLTPQIKCINKPIEVSNISKSYYQLVNLLQEKLIQIHQNKINQQLQNAVNEFRSKQAIFCKKELCSQIIKANQWIPKKPELKKTTYSYSTCLRLFKKWRSFEIEDGLSASSMIMKLLNKEIEQEEALQMLLQDYDLQVVKPRNKYIDDLVYGAKIYSSLYQELLYEEQSYQRMLSINRFTIKSYVQRQKQQKEDSPQESQFVVQSSQSLQSVQSGSNSNLSSFQFGNGCQFSDVISINDDCQKYGGPIEDYYEISQ